MNILQLSTLATVLLVELFKSAVSETGKKIVGGLFEIIKSKFGGRKAAENA